ncbi:MAG: hypothetical protein D6818_10140, partial [Bacteroidetes bacterium]
EELIAAFDALCQEAQWTHSHRMVQAYIENNAGATGRILDALAPLLQQIKSNQPEKIEDAAGSRTL